MRQPIETQRREKAILGILEYYDGVPLSVVDVSEESGLSMMSCQHILGKMWGRYVVQRRVNELNKKPHFEYWIGMRKV